MIALIAPVALTSPWWNIQETGSEVIDLLIWGPSIVLVLTFGSQGVWRKSLHGYYRGRRLVVKNRALRTSLWVDGEKRASEPGLVSGRVCTKLVFDGREVLVEAEFNQARYGFGMTCWLRVDNLTIASA